MFQAGDIDGLLQFFSDDVEWIGAPTELVPFSGDYHGKQVAAAGPQRLGQAINKIPGLFLRT